jgi:hypothetical protein
MFFRDMLPSPIELLTFLETKPTFEIRENYFSAYSCQGLSLTLENI